MERILVALDASSRAPHVLDEAVELARKTGAKLRLYRAVGIPTEIPESALMGKTQALVSMLVEQAKQDLDALKRAVPAELFDGASVSIATAWDGICRVAKDYHADLIVIGSHGYNVIDRLLGTTAARVVNHADTAVMVVR
jgi:nucleotide-binding universal stress UspA family protein